MEYTPTKGIHADTNNKSNVWLWFSRIVVGLVFIFSGLVKANDPLGFAYKLEEYFSVFGPDIFVDYSLSLSIFICGLEIVLGSLLILGVAKRMVAWGLLLLIVFFSFLTLYSAFFKVVTSCGCFGDVIPLTPWQSFIKDLVLLILIVVVFWFRRDIRPLINSNFANSLLVFIIVFFAFGIGTYTANYLPIVDFLPYKVGNNIPHQMSLPKNAQPDIYKHIYQVKDLTTGKTKTISDSEYMNQKIWEDENIELIGEPQTILVKAGSLPAISDLHIINSEDQDVTQEIISNPYMNFLVVCKDLTNLSEIDLMALEQINNTIREISEDYPIRAVLLTNSRGENVQFLIDQMDLVLETFNADDVPLKTMVRSDPGVLLLQNGNVVAKWSSHSFPSKNQIVDRYFQ